MSAIFLQQYKKFREIPEDTIPAISFVPEWWFESIGLEDFDVNPENEYGSTSNDTQLASLKSLYSDRYAVPTGVDDFSFGGVNGAQQLAQFTVGSVEWDLDTAITNIGDFTWCCRAFLPAGTLTTSSVKNVFGAAADGNALRRIFTDRIRFTFGGATINAYWNAGHTEIVLDRVHDIVVQREGTTFRVCCVFEGETLSLETYTVNSGQFDIENLRHWNSSYHWVASFIRDVFVKEALTPTQLREVFDWNFDGTQTFAARPTSATLSLPDISFTSLPASKYIAKTNLDKVSGHASTKQKILTVGDKTFIHHHLNTSAPIPFQNLMVIFNHTGNSYHEKSLGNFGQGTDYHEHGSFILCDNRILHLFNDIYGAGGNRLYFQKSGENFNVSIMADDPIYNNRVGYNCGAEQYLASKVIDNQIILCQQYYGGGSSDSYSLIIKRSRDYGNSWQDKIKIADDEITSRWLYPRFINNWNEPDEFIFAFHYVYTTPTPRLFEGWGLIRVLKADIEAGNYTLTSLDGLTTWDATTDGVMTLAQIVSNFGIKDIGAGVKDVYLWDIKQDDTGEFYGITSDGAGGLEMFFGSVGGSMTFRAITGHGVSLVDYNGDGHIGAAIWKTATNNYSVAIKEDYLTYPQVRKLTTTDKGSTWADGGRLTTKLTDIHHNIVSSFNYDEFGKGVLGCTVRDAGETESTHYWIYEI